MPKPFYPLSIADFAQLLRAFHFTRKVTTIHLHHTWRPTRADYRGLSTIEAMWRYHTQTQKWSDIAQHVSIAPDGVIWTGRNWNRPPASAKGYNGDDKAGPFMIEMIGDFDRGRELLDGPQREATLEVIARMQMHFQLPPGALAFHNEMSSKSCPGNGVDKQQLLAELRAIHQRLSKETAAAAARGGPFPHHGQLFGDLANTLNSDASVPTEPVEDELPEADEAGAEPSIGEGARYRPQYEALRPYVINLRGGQLDDGDGWFSEFSTSTTDVEAIFHDHLPRALREARQRGEKLRLLFFAHGGLVSEEDALHNALAYYQWWLDNGVYPIFFIWETGLGETLSDMLRRGRGAAPIPEEARAARGLGDLFDPVTEQIVRTLGAGAVWEKMKASAANAAMKGGGAHYVAECLKAFCDKNSNEVELFAIGHSAGSIFHAHFIPAALAMQVPPFTGTYFLAPAITIDLFSNTLAGLVGSGIERLSLFTMRRSLELDDNCARVYRKSLLYLIHYALEPKRETPLLGLEESLRKDGAMRRLFGLEGTPAAAADVVWSVSDDGPDSASDSRAHGDFDNNRKTMESVLRRMLALPGGQPLKRPFPTQRSRAAAIPSALAEAPPCPPPQPAVGFAAPMTFAAAAPVTATAGRRVALCIGIDDYPQAPLAGCVADARAWAAALGRLGFSTELLLDARAHRAAILEALVRLVAGARPGDVVVIQFSGHGTQVPDDDGDEEDSQDEAIVPHDYLGGGLVIDDDLADIFARIAPGANVTLFLDCCHSGTATRFAVGAPPRGRGGDERVRYLAADEALIAQHRRFRAALGPVRATFGAPPDMRQVVFSACQPSELAYENHGQGDFTRHALGVLAGGLAGLTHSGFQARVEAAFGSYPRQRPMLDCAANRRGAALLQPYGTAHGGSDEVRALLAQAIELMGRGQW